MVAALLMGGGYKAAPGLRQAKTVPVPVLPLISELQLSEAASSERS
jgi:hypothetical protein